MKNFPGEFQTSLFNDEQLNIKNKYQRRAYKAHRKWKTATKLTQAMNAAKIGKKTKEKNK